MARQLAKALDYAEFINFLPVIKKAIKACENSGQPESDHFVEMHEMVPIGSGAEREMESYARHVTVNKCRGKEDITAQRDFTMKQLTMKSAYDIGGSNLSPRTIDKIQNLYTAENSIPTKPLPRMLNCGGFFVPTRCLHEIPEGR